MELSLHPLEMGRESTPRFKICVCLFLPMFCPRHLDLWLWIAHIPLETEPSLHLIFLSDSKLRSICRHSDDK